MTAGDGEAALRERALAARDVRLGGSWTPAQRLKNEALWILARAALACASRVPRRWLRAAGRTLGAIAHATARAPRRVAEANVARVFPDWSARERAALVRRCFATLGDLLGDTIDLLGPGGGALLPLSAGAREVLDAARREGRGVVFPSAHLGPWERVAASLVAAGIPLVTIARESYDPRFSRLYDRLRGGRGVGVVWRSGPGAAARILRTLRAGGVLGVPMDLRSRVASCDAPFLGHVAPTAAGPARLALRTGAPVVVGTAALDGEDPSWTITATRIASEDLPCTDAGVAELTARINAEISRRILAAPHAWVWMHDRWASRHHLARLGAAGPPTEV